MILSVEDNYLVVTVSLGFEGNTEFQVKFSMEKVQELIEGKTEDLFEISESEDEASGEIDSLVWGNDL